MSQWLRNSALCFAAGCGGGLFESVVAWTAAHFGITAVIGTHGATALQAVSLYAHVVWGGLWGLLFLLPLLRNRVVVGGVIAGLLVTLIHWLVLPLWWHSGLHFALWPLLNAVLLNVVWGIATALLLKWL